jgi:uncharacterized damage-inducible protein DinB
MTPTTNRVDEIVERLNEVTRDARAAFGGLSHEQLNWRETPERWSVAQCLDHLITMNRLYFPLLGEIRAGAARPTAWERLSPFSGFFGKLLIRSLSPDNPRKTKTSPKAEPSSSDIDVGIIDRFARHQVELIEHIRGIPSSVDRGRRIVTSPLAAFVTYSLDDCLTILVVHEQRHVQQAKRVMEAGGFPR